MKQTRRRPSSPAIQPATAPHDRPRRVARLRAAWLATFVGVLAVLVMGRVIRVAAAPDPATPSGDTRVPASLRLDVNQADPDELRLLPGVGGILAERIVEHRERRGPFTSSQDLEAVSGIGAVTRQRLRPWITARPADP